MFDITNLSSKTGGTLTGASSRAAMGNTLKNAGDVNEDGIDDFIVGAKGTLYDTGAAYVIYGDANNLPVNATVGQLTGKNGFTIVSGASNEREFATSVSGVGDINVDDIDDVIVGSPNANNQAGQATACIWQ